jgi:hypothetical protein
MARTVPIPAAAPPAPGSSLEWPDEDVATGATAGRDSSAAQARDTDAPESRGEGGTFETGTPHSGRTDVYEIGRAAHADVEGFQFREAERAADTMFWDPTRSGTGAHPGPFDGIDPSLLSGSPLATDPPLGMDGGDEDTAVAMAPRIEQRAEVPVRVYEAERIVKVPRRKRPRGDDLGFELTTGTQSVLYAAIAALLALAILLQAAFWFRSDVAGYFPGARDALATLCYPVGCTVDWPRKIDDLVIDNSDLRADGGVLTLSATLRNRGSMMLALPTIELTITDDRGVPIALRRLPPAEYLGDRRQAAGGIAAGTELSIEVHLDATQLAASGYRLLVLYA